MASLDRAAALRFEAVRPFGWLVLVCASCAPAPLEEEAPPSGGARGSETEPAPPPSPAPFASMPRPSRGRGEQAARANAECAGCHEEEAEQWERSRHHASSSNDAYRAALAIEPSPFCQGCHAPEAQDPRAMAPDPLGVACVTCHVTREGEVLASGEGDELEPSAHHAIRRSVAFGHTGACASCHEFRFPHASGDDDERFMQTTVREHAASGAADRSCADCHMQAGSHDLANVRDPAWLRRNVRASAALDDFGVLVRLETGAGHAFPTGDLFRRCEVGAELRDARGRVLASDVRYLARHFELSPGQPERRLVADDRVRGSAELLLDLQPTGAARSVRWWVTYQRVALTGDGRDPRTAVVESQVPLHEGTLTLPPLRGSK